MTGRRRDASEKSDSNGTLWYGLFRGELCRIRKGLNDRLICEAWRNGSWAPGPNFAKVDFKGRMISEDEAKKWIQNHFRGKRIGEKSPQ